MIDNEQIYQAMKIKLDDSLPAPADFDPQYRRAPKRNANLSAEDKRIALKNALRYVPPQHHQLLAAEFLEELEKHGRIYAYRYRPKGPIKAKPVDEYQGSCLAGKAMQLMIDNNLDRKTDLPHFEKDS